MSRRSFLYLSNALAAVEAEDETDCARNGTAPTASVPRSISKLYEGS